MGTFAFIQLMVLIMLSAIGAVTERGALHEAVKRGDTHHVLHLLNNSADVNAVIPPGDTPLILAARLNNAEIAGILIEAGAALDARNNQGDTPLHIAARAGNVETLRILLAAAGVDPNIRNDQTGATPLHAAASRGQSDIVQELLAAGADKTAADNDGKRPLDMASRGQHLNVIQLLGGDAPGKQRRQK